MSLPQADGLLVEQRGGALFVTLNRPQAKNALSAAMVEGLMALCDALGDRRDIRAVVLRGAGGAFCAGGDVKDFGRMLMAPAPADGDEDIVVKGNRVFGDLLLRLDALPQVLIAAVEGPAFGGANGLIAVADAAICEAGARLSLSETTLGVVPAQIAPFLVRKIGLFNTRRLALTGAHYSPEEALRIGLVDRIVTGPAALESAVIETLNFIGRCEPEANAATKRVLNAAAGAVDPALLDAAASEFAACLRGKGREGAMAFAAKQAPPWVETFPETSDA